MKPLIGLFAVLLLSCPSQGSDFANPGEWSFRIDLPLNWRQFDRNEMRLATFLFGPKAQPGDSEPCAGFVRIDPNNPSPPILMVHILKRGNGRQDFEDIGRLRDHLEQTLRQRINSEDEKARVRFNRFEADDERGRIMIAMETERDNGSFHRESYVHVHVGKDYGVILEFNSPNPGMYQAELDKIFASFEWKAGEERPIAPRLNSPPSSLLYGAVCLAIIAILVIRWKQRNTASRNDFDQSTGN